LEGDEIMNIKAKLYNTHTVRIVAFVPAFKHDVLAVYVDAWGKINTCDIEDIIIIDPEYALPNPGIEALKKNKEGK
jgi:hypothetical protein